jgi:hypothetical protein
MIFFFSAWRVVDLHQFVPGDARSRQTVSSHGPLARIAKAAQRPEK